MKANRKQNAVNLTTSKPNRANCKQTKEITYVTVLTALVQYSSVHAGFLLEAWSRVPGPVYFEQSARLLKVRN